MNPEDFIVISIENYITSDLEFKKKYKYPIFIEKSGEFKYNENSVSKVIIEHGQSGYNIMFFVLSPPEEAI